MDIFTGGPAEPEAREHEEGPCDAGEREAHHFLIAGPGLVESLCPRKVPVPAEVEAGGDEGADADGEEGEALFAGGEVVDAGEDDGVGLEVYVEDGICFCVSLAP